MERKKAYRKPQLRARKMELGVYGDYDIGRNTPIAPPDGNPPWKGDDLHR